MRSELPSDNSTTSARLSCTRFRVTPWPAISVLAGHGVLAQVRFDMRTGTQSSQVPTGRW